MNVGSSSAQQRTYCDSSIQEAFLYRRLDRSDTTPEQAWEILATEPTDPKRRANLIDNADTYVIRFHFASLPDWMGLSSDDFRSIYLFSYPEKLWELWNSSGGRLDQSLIDDFISKRCRDENQAHIGHYICKWNDPRKLDLIKYLIQSTQTQRFIFSERDENGLLPLELFICNAEQRQLIDLLIEIQPSEPLSPILSVLMDLQNLTLAKLLVERRADALLCVDLLQETPVFGSDPSERCSPFFQLSPKRYSPLVKLSPEKHRSDFEFFFDQWDEQIAAQMGFSSTFFRVLYLPNSSFKREEEYWHEIPPILRKAFNGVKAAGTALNIRNFLGVCAGSKVLRNVKTLPKIQLLLLALFELTKRPVPLEILPMHIHTEFWVIAIREFLSLPSTGGEEDHFYKPLIKLYINWMFKESVFVGKDFASILLSNFRLFQSHLQNFSSDEDRALMKDKLRGYLLEARDHSNPSNIELLLHYIKDVISEVGEISHEWPVMGENTEQEAAIKVFNENGFLIALSEVISPAASDPLREVTRAAFAEIQSERDDAVQIYGGVVMQSHYEEMSGRVVIEYLENGIILKEIKVYLDSNFRWKPFYNMLTKAIFSEDIFGDQDPSLPFQFDRKGVDFFEMQNQHLHLFNLKIWRSIKALDIFFYDPSTHHEVSNLMREFYSRHPLENFNEILKEVFPESGGALESLELTPPCRNLFSTLYRAQSRVEEFNECCRPFLNEDQTLVQEQPSVSEEIVSQSLLDDPSRKRQRNLEEINGPVKVQRTNQQIHAASSHQEVAEGQDNPSDPLTMREALMLLKWKKLISIKNIQSPSSSSSIQ